MHCVMVVVAVAPVMMMVAPMMVMMPPVAMVVVMMMMVVMVPMMMRHRLGFSGSRRQCERDRQRGSGEYNLLHFVDFPLFSSGSRIRGEIARVKMNLT
jgi:hypothetical protein